MYHFEAWLHLGGNYPRPYKFKIIKHFDCYEVEETATYKGGLFTPEQYYYMRNMAKDYFNKRQYSYERY